MADAERGRSVEIDGRRVNTVTPLHLNGESAMLKNLWQEAQVQQKQQQIFADEEKEKKLHQMLEKYQTHVRRHQQMQEKYPMTTQTNVETKAEVDGCSTHPSMSHSQPCLLAMSEPSALSHPRGLFERCASTEHDSSGGPARQVGSNQKLIQSLREDNLQLRQQIELLKKKAVRLEQLESAHKKIESEYEGLMREKEKQDTLEKSAFVTMDLQIKRLVKENDSLQDQLTRSSTPHAMEQISKLNMLVAELIPQGNEMKATINRQTVEIQAQRVTLEEQRTHIAMLETALSNAQDRLARKEKMCEEQAASTERISYLERLLHDAIVDKQQRDKSHVEERARLEMEITQLKMQITKESGGVAGIKKGSARAGVDDNTVYLKKVIFGKDERITHLERDVMELQRRLHEETEKKNAALDALSESLEAKIKRLEDERIDKDRRIAELTEEKGRMEELLDEQREEDSTRRDLHKMEELRQRIEERKRRHHPDITSMRVDHSPSGSASLRPAFDLVDSASLLSGISNSSRLSGSSNQFISSYGSRPSNGSYGLFQYSQDDHTLPESSNVWNV